MKYFLLIVNNDSEDHYPRPGTHDWVDCFKTYEEALEESRKIFGLGTTVTIVDLRDWIK